MPYLFNNLLGISGVCTENCCFDPPKRINPTRMLGWFFMVQQVVLDTVNDSLLVIDMRQNRQNQM